MPSFRRVAALVAGVCLAAALLAMGFADRLIFVPPDASYGEGLEGLLRLESSVGDTVAARFVEAPGSGQVVLFAHGNAEDLGHGRWYADQWVERGVSVLSFDYPGYGLSTGRPSEEGAYAAVDAAYRYLLDELGYAPASVIAHGRSLGGAVTVDLASREPVGGLVMESTFVSAYRVMTRWQVVPIDQFESLKKLPAVDAPVLVIHGGLDRVVGPWHGRRLFEALPEERRRSLWVDQAGHNDLWLVAGERYWRALEAFVRDVGDPLE